ncbi:hypothetical protein CC78DRAFT_621905 [Lojkania enalia]|uniref:Uncharacterized protein n=1 Tax=Lojkania enalia TaxID=147567 RepID=A0A9P4JXB5_9PLEO|nr:hypothetical protein CC78DRAFT_621905 [Didymosphaeria enalia]
MRSLYDVMHLHHIQYNRAKTFWAVNRLSEELDDFITRGVIGEHEAENLSAVFRTSLNHRLLVELEQFHDGLESIRRISEMLAATILTVTKLYKLTSAETFNKYHKEFFSLISSSMLSLYHLIGDVSSLYIAAFWPSDEGAVSWKFSGHAIRIATELDIQNFIYKVIEGDSEYFLPRSTVVYALCL